MYFIPQHNRWYSVIAHTSSLYRYGILFTLSFFIILAWRYGIYVYLDTLIQKKQAQLMQYKGRAIELAMIERNLAKIKEADAQLCGFLYQVKKLAVGDLSEDQCNYLFEKALKYKLHICSYHVEHQKIKSWKRSNYVLLKGEASLENLKAFLVDLKEEKKLVQCCSLQCKKKEDNELYSIICAIQFLTINS